MTKHYKQVVGAALAISALTACSSDHPAEPSANLRSLVEGNAGAALDHTRAGQSYLMGVGPLCVTKPASATITSMRLTPIHGRMLLQTWAVRRTDQVPPGTDDPGAVAGDFSHYRNFNRKPIGTSCKSADKLTTQLVLQVARTGTASATIKSIMITYKSQKRTGRLAIPFTVSLCAANDPYRPGHC